MIPEEDKREGEDDAVEDGWEAKSVFGMAEWKKVSRNGDPGITVWGR